MKHMQVLKRAWHILWNFRVLWVFGIILALTTPSVRNTSSYQTSNNDNQRYEFNYDKPILPQITEVIEQGIKEGQIELDLLRTGDNTEQFAYQLIQAVLWFSLVLITLLLLAQVFRYISETSLIKMVDQYEDSGEKATTGEGFRLGWSREAWRIFLSDLVIEIPFFLAALLVGGLVLVPILTWSSENTAGSLVTMLTSIGLAILLGLLLLAVRAVLAVIKPLIRREIALKQATVIEAIRSGFKLARQYWKETGLMWLILFGIDIVWPLFLIPLALVTIFLAGSLGVGVALLIGGEAFTTGGSAAFWGIVVGLTFFIIVLMIPLGFVNGLKETFKSSTWTLTYREIIALKSLENGDAPKVETELPAS